MSDESFYTLHDDFDPDAAGGVRWRVCPILVRSIERWCSQIHYIEPIDRQDILDRSRVRHHFNRWCLQVEMLDRCSFTDAPQAAGEPSHRITSLLNPQTSFTESLCEYLLVMLRRYPQDPTIQRHWIAFFMHRCVVVGWKIWKSTPSKLRSFCLFQEITIFGHRQLPDFNQATPFLANFAPEKSQLVNGLDRITVYLDRQIKYSILPDLRKVLGDPNFGRSNLGVASRCSLSKIEAALKNIQLTEIELEEYKILWQCFSIYKKETGIAANLMGASDFQTVEQNYRIRSMQTMNILKGTDVKTLLESIGKIVRDFMLRETVNLDANINESQSLADITPDRTQNLFEYQIFQERLNIFNTEIEKICTEPNLSNLNPSHKQLFWLRYGLDLKQSQIGMILQANFPSNDANPGSVCRRLSRSHQQVFDRIHLALKNTPPPITEREINTAVSGLLEHYFDSMISAHILTSAANLGLSNRVQQRSIAEEAQLLEHLTNWFQQQIDLHIPVELFRITMLQILDRFFYQP
jgi:hypothetical protein